MKTILGQQLAQPLPSLHPAWTSYTNGNFVCALLVQTDFVWAATSGGVVRWTRSTGEYIKYTLLDRFTHYQDSLFQLLAPLITEPMLATIAAADYHMDFEAHLAALRRIHAGEIPVPLQWEPREVLELVRYSEPEPRGTGPAGHLRRTFACTALLLAASEPENRAYLLGPEHETIGQLIASLLTLDIAFQRAGLRLLSERVLALDLEDDGMPFFALGILLLAVTVGDTDPAHIDELAIWVLQAEGA